MIDQLDWIALTVKQEAENEPYEGKLAVAYTITTRMRLRKLSASQTVLQKLQYSCWNATSPTRMRLDPDLANLVWRDSYKAAEAALKHLEPDPTDGCWSYLNPNACTLQQMKAAGYDAKRVYKVIGRHHFFIPA